jgi:hypothetical protein
VQECECDTDTVLVKCGESGTELSEAERYKDGEAGGKDNAA